MFGFFFTIAVIAIILYNQFYKKCPPNSALVIIDKSNPSRKKLKNVITGEGAFVNPLTEDFKILTFNPSKIGIIQKNTIIKYNSKIDIDITCMVAFSRKKTLVQRAASELIYLSPFEILKQAKELITEQLNLTCVFYTKDEINKNKNFTQDLEKNSNTILKDIGMEIVHIFINSVKNSSGETQPQKQIQQSQKETKKYVKKSFGQEFNEIAKKEVEKIEEETNYTDIIGKPFNNESFEEFKALTENFPSFKLNNDFEQIKEQEQKQEQEVKQELTGIIKKVVEKNMEISQENYTKPSAKPVYNKSYYSEPTTVEQTNIEPTPSDDIFASVRHYFENKNQ